jgi:predicted metal-dependent enzyme (double-stranded beta helix superfamily)
MMRAGSETVAEAVRSCATEVAGYVAANGGDPMAAEKQIVESIAKFLKRPDLIGVGLPRPAVNADTSRILYYDPSIMFVMGYSTGGGRYDPPHNHGNWIATGVYRGEVEYTDYRRVDDGSQPGHAKLEKVAHGILKAGDVALTPPPPHDIHSNTWLTENYTLIVIGGGFASKRNYYDPKTDTYIEKVTA